MVTKSLVKMSLSGDWPVFSVDEKDILRQSWSILSINLEGLGIQIYEMIFEQVSISYSMYSLFLFK